MLSRETPSLLRLRTPSASSIRKRGPGTRPLGRGRACVHSHGSLRNPKSCGLHVLILT